MPFMLKIQWDIKAGREADFRANQAALCKVMLEHPGVICYHALLSLRSVLASGLRSMQPTRRSRRTSPTRKARVHWPPLIDACDKITCQCWGNPNAGSKEILADFGPIYHETATNAFLLNPRADRDSRI